MLRLPAMSLALLMVCRMGMAQVAAARLEGVVQDASGAVVPGAKVSVVNTRTQSLTETLVSPEGLFAFPSLQPSLYELSAEAAGFRRAVVSDLELNVGGTVSQTVVLQVGDLTQSVTVVAGAVRVQNSDAQISRATTLRDIEVLPELDRAPLQLAIFNPGIQIDPTDWYSLSRVNGTRTGSNNARLDGIDTNDAMTPRLVLSVAPFNQDSIEEFRIVTSGGKAEYGRSAGAQIDLITRSGSNTLHGNAFEYHRNTVLNANTFFNNSSGNERPVFIQNIFGASLGGPIHRDRTFIFANYQGQRTAQQEVRNRLVLTSEAKAGVFRWKSAGSPFDIVANDPKHKGIDLKVAEILKLLPDPNNSDIGDGLNTAGFRFNAPAGRTGDQYTVRADHTLWSGHRLFFRWGGGRTLYIDTINGQEATYPGQLNGTQGGSSYAYSIGSDWSITPRLVNELRVGGDAYTWDFLRPARLPDPMLRANSWTDPLNPAFSSGRRLPVHQVTDNLTIVQGKHIFKAGLEWRFTSQRTYNYSGAWPNVSFDTTNAPVPASAGPAGLAIEDRRTFERLYNDLLGRMGLVTQRFYSDLEKFQPAGTPRARAHRFREYGYFFQDDWRIHPRFVLNLGLRYEFSGVPIETGGYEGTVDKAALISSTARLADLAIQRSSRWYNNDFNNFAPRVGFAWDPTGSGKTALRANWGIFYDRLIGATAGSVDNNTPGFAQVVNLYPNRASGADARLSDGIPLPQQPTAPILRPAANRGTDNLFLFAPNLRTGYVQHYSLTLQREIFKNTFIEAGYVGTHGTKLFMDLNLNQPRIYEDFLRCFRELQAFRASGVPPSGSNTLVRMFGGSAASAVDAVGDSNLRDGTVGTAAESFDRLKFGSYASAGVSDFYLRNFPQFKNVVVGTNDGRSYYDSFQLSLRRQTGALRFVANYTFSKTIDNTSSEGQGFTSPIDNFNVRLNRARGDYDIPHAFNSSIIYALPFGKGRPFAGRTPRWVDSFVGGWDLGLLTIWQSGRVVTYLSGYATGPTTLSSFVDYTGDRNIGGVMRQGDGVYWLTPEEITRFSVPQAGEIGTGGRNSFRGPRFFNADISMAKKFRITERQAISFRAEAYNLFNNANFAAPNATLDASFGKLSANVGNARVLQGALRYEF